MSSVKSCEVVSADSDQNTEQLTSLKMVSSECGGVATFDVFATQVQKNTGDKLSHDDKCTATRRTTYRF